MAIELAGFRIVDIVHHANGSGFPKAQDIGKLIDNMAGVEREIVGKYIPPDGKTRKAKAGMGLPMDGSLGEWNTEITAPATDEAKHWDGWKTPALKPAVEGWWLIQKPISESSIARNILKHGVGGINIEACRIEGEGWNRPSSNRDGYTYKNTDFRMKDIDKISSNAGRYPANLVLSCGANCDGGDHSSDCPVSLFPESNSGGRSTAKPGQKCGYDGGWGRCEVVSPIPANDKGTAARYFKQLPFDPETATSIYYQAKASKSDRSCGGVVPNVHPTVKSRHLIAYFLKLITPPGGVVLDCFGGSGTTAVAAIENGFNYCLIEKESEYIEIINQRIAAVSKTIVFAPATIIPIKTTQPQQLSLFA
jgi:site-specific DNA-methyltransferase (adenine-specific)